MRTRLPISAAEVHAGVRDAGSRSWHVRKRLKVPDRDQVHPAVLGDVSLAIDEVIAARAADAVLLICDDWPRSEAATAALIVAADRAGDDRRPVTALYDPRLMAWLATHLDQRPDDTEEAAA